MSAPSWRDILGVDPGTPRTERTQGTESHGAVDSVRCVLSVPTPPPSTTRPAGASLDPAELRRRYAEHAAALAGWAGLTPAEVELRAWTETALDYIEADPAANALPNREARALAARVLAAAGIPDPAASPLRLERGGRRHA